MDFLFWKKLGPELVTFRYYFCRRDRHLRPGIAKVWITYFNARPSLNPFDLFIFFFHRSFFIASLLSRLFYHNLLHCTILS